MIRKDFTGDEYQIYQAKVLGADAVLLICTLLDTETIRDYIGICDKLGISALVETHDAQEMQSAVRAGARLIGVNNRNLKDFTVDLGNAARLREGAPDGYGLCSRERRFLSRGCGGTAKDRRGCRSGRRVPHACRR